MGPQSHESKNCSEEGDMFYREIEEWIKLVISEEEDDHDERSPLRAMNRDPIHLPQKPFLDPIWCGSSFNDIAKTWDVGYRVGRENHAWVRPEAVQPSRSSPILRRSPEACRRRGTGVFIPKVASVAYRTAAVLRH